MRKIAIHTCFDVFYVFKIAAALVTQRIQRTVAKKAIKRLFAWLFMAREVFAMMVFKKSMTIFQ